MTRKILTLCLSFLIATPLFAMGALEQGKANICAYGGMAPSYFGAKKKFYIRTDTATYQTSLHSFHDHFRFPFIFGGSAGYSFTRNFEVNISADYVTARGETFTWKDSGSTFKLGTGTFGSFGCYIGARYYIDCGTCWYPFIGLRAGIQARRATRASSFVTTPLILTEQSLVDRGAFLHRQTVAAGGASLGFDGPLTEYVNIFIMGELNYSGKIKSEHIRPYDVNIKSFRTMPVVVGLRFIAE